MLKKTFLFLFLISYSFGMQISDDPSFKKIYQQKQNSNKILLMLYSAKSCPQCAYIKQKVFKENKVKKFLNEHFVILEKDVNKDDLPSGFDFFGIPTMFFVDKNGTSKGKIIGSSRAEPFLKQLEQVIREVNSK